MRKSNVDAQIIVICFCFTVYYVVFDKLFVFVYSTIMIGLISVVFMLIYVLQDELESVNRYFFVRQFYIFKKRVRQKVRRGLREQKEWMEDRKKD